VALGAGGDPPLETGVQIRVASVGDTPTLAALIDGFAVGHPAEKRHRSIEKLKEAFFGNRPVGEHLLAETSEGAVGYAGWRRIYDVFWSMFGGQVIGLYVQPSHRGRGIAAMLIAALCARVRDEGGRYLWSEYDAHLAPFYERVAVGKPCKECHLAGLAFQQVADLAGASGREIVAGLPKKELNLVSDEEGA
jgi:GNAT superfamily N-acetyltransferase